MKKGHFNMYHSRKRFCNEYVSLAFDTQTGELLELTDLTTGDNLIKNFPLHTHQPLWLSVRQAVDEKSGQDPENAQEAVYAFDNKVPLEGEDSVEAWPVQAGWLDANPSLRPVIQSQCLEDGTLRIQVRYLALETQHEMLCISALCEIDLPPDSAQMRWRLTLENNSGLTIEKVAFPAVNGLYFSDGWKKDTLVYPYFSGEKIVNPVEEYAKKPSVLHWKWQRYRHAYLVDGTFRWVAPNGAYCREMPYGGSVSMPWLDYYGQTNGLYLACHETDARVLSMRSETFGPDSPGMGFAIVHHPFAGQGQWQSPECVLALHPGDWHWGADYYRAARKASDSLVRHTRPKWLEKEPGLVAHYDFMYQNGETVHRFCDIPVLYEQAREMGMSVLLLSGWHTDGFDCGFPLYAPSEALGGVQELSEAVKAVRGAGGHVMFYMNARLGNTAYQELAQERDAQCARDINGKLITASYGDERIEFANHCPNDPAWQNRIAERVQYLTQQIGASGVYLDQLAMASPIFCFHPDHQHHPADWCRGNQQLLTRLFDRYEPGNEPAIFYEGAVDLYGAGVSGQLVSTFVHNTVGAFPELYRYTFPDQLLVDMLYPRCMQAMRPVLVAQQGMQVLHRAFLIGMFYWVYDLEEDNSFYNDPDMLLLLTHTTALRRTWLTQFGAGIFRDEEGIVSVAEGVRAKRFSLPGGDMLFTLSNPLSIEQAQLTVELPKAANANWSAKGYLLSRPNEAVNIGFSIQGNRMILGVPMDELALFWLHQN